jgi:hypothetical protein
MKIVQNSLLQFAKAKAEEQGQGGGVTKIGLITFNKFVQCYDLSSSLNAVVCIGADQNDQTSDIKRLLESNRSSIDKYFISPKISLAQFQKRVSKLRGEGSILNENDS